MQHRKVGTALFGFQPATIRQQLLYLAGMGITLAAPGGTKRFLREMRACITQLPGKPEPKPKQISQALYALKKRKLIKLTQEGKMILLTLTEGGDKRCLRYAFEALKIPRPRKWDGKWRLVLFDIPEDLKAAREALRSKLKQLGFLQFQKSVWIYPHQCEDEIDFISELFAIGRYLNLLAVEIEKDQPLRAHFKL